MLISSETHLSSNLPRIALDVWGIGTMSPRGVVTLKRLYAKACAHLAKTYPLQICFVGEKADRRWLEESDLLQGNTFRIFRIPGRLQQVATKASFLPFTKLLDGATIYHSFTLYPFNSGYTTIIGTLVDFVPMRVPEYSSLDLTLAQVKWCKWASQNPKAKWIAISEQTRRDAIELGRVKPDQVISVNLSVDDDMFREPSAEEVSSTLCVLGVHPSYVLCVNTFNNRKNHGRLLQAWQQGKFAKAGWQLVLVGHPADNPIVEQMAKGEIPGVKWLGYVARPQLIHLYYGCDFFVYPSIYEGFGIPIAEAIVAGKAIVTTRRSCMADIAGNSAIQIDPLEIDSLVDGLSDMIHDSALRSRLASNSLARRGYFSIHRLADELLAAYSTQLQGD